MVRSVAFDRGREPLAEAIDFETSAVFPDQPLWSDRRPFEPSRGLENVPTDLLPGFIGRFALVLHRLLPPGFRSRGRRDECHRFVWEFPRIALEERERVSHFIGEEIFTPTR